MKRFFGLAILALMALGGSDSMSADTGESRKSHTEYDFHYDIRYPGTLRSDVGLDKVTEANSADLKSYNRRVVEWWPKRGVDFTPLEDIPGAPLRTWTPRVPKHSNSGSLPGNFPTEPFKAHLVNFRGIGDDSLKDVKDPESYRCPAAVLRLSDGRKRVFLAKYLSEADRQYLIKIYTKEMKRVQSKLLQAEYAPSPGVLGWPEGEDQLYVNTDKVRFDTKHASIVVPANAPNGGTGNSWVKKENHAQVMQTVNYLKNQMEAYWAYHEYGGAFMRYWEKDKLYKYYPIFGHGGGGGGGGYATCSLGGPGFEGVLHEYGHGMPRGGMLSIGGGETRCDSLQIMGDPANIHKVDHQIQRPWKNLFHGAYPGGGGYEIIADDPNWGYTIAATTSCLTSMEDTTPMHAYAHLGEERGLWKKGDGIRGVGDMLGQVGARLAEFDCQQEYQFRNFAVSANRSYLVPVDVKKGIYRCPANEAPEPFGVSISRLVPEQGAKKITVDFQGDFDPETYSDWRACIVAVDKDNKCRYTPLWNKGEMSMETQPGDKRYWLTVTATPKALLKGGLTDSWIIYQGGFAYAYPYQVTLTGAMAGSAYGTLAENNNMDLVGPDWSEAAYLVRRGVAGHAYDLLPTMTPAERKAMKQSLEEKVKTCTKIAAKYDKIVELLPPETDGALRWSYLLPARMAKANVYRATFLLDNLEGAPHPNGGGWVSAQARVAPSAYVGPHCVVMGKATVMDNAQLVDNALVIGDGAVVKPNAKLSHKALILGPVILEEWSRLYGSVANRKLPTASAAEKAPKTIRGIPMRGHEESSGYLIANYDPRTAETVAFEDLLRKRGTGHFFFGPHGDKHQINYNGRLAGKPGFSNTGSNGAVVFNGQDQHAEIAPEVVDLGELMIAMRVKLDAIGTPQTLFDFGSSLDNRMTLVVDKKGKPILQWTLKGKTHSLPGFESIVPGQWATLRVEIDGDRVALYVNESAAEKTSDFRAAYVFVPGLARRNFVFRSRDEKNPDYAAGQLDYVRVYSEVAEDFAALPAPPLTSPTKAVPEILTVLTEQFGDHPAKKRTYKEIASKTSMMNRAKNWHNRTLYRLYTHQLGSDPATIENSLAVRDTYYRMLAKLELKKIQLKREYPQSAEVKATRSKIAALHKERDKLRSQEKTQRKALEKAYKDAPEGSPKAKAYQAYLEARKAADAKRKRQHAEREAEKKRIARARKKDKATARAKREASPEKQLQKKEAQANEVLKQIRAEVATSVKPQQDALKVEIDALQKELDARIQVLSEKEGPVAEVFAPAIAKGKHVNELKKIRDTVLKYRPTWRNPGTGLLYRDLKAVALQMKLDDATRASEALVYDKLMDNTAYFEASIRKQAIGLALGEVRREKHRKQKEARESGAGLRGGKPSAPAPVGEYAKALDKITTEARADQNRLHGQIRSLNQSIGQGVKPFMQKKLQKDILAVDAARVAWDELAAKNAKASHADETDMVNMAAYFRRYYIIQPQRLDDALGDTMAGQGAVDDLAQLKSALTLQTQWQTSTDDWDTEHKLEKNYETRNPIIQRWLKRVKPYRYEKVETEE